MRANSIFSRTLCIIWLSSALFFRLWQTASSHTKNEKIDETKQTAYARECPFPLTEASSTARFVYNRTTHMDQIFDEHPDTTLLIIGANVGDTISDASWGILHKHISIKKIFIELIPGLAQRLKKNVEFAGLQNAIVDNVAVADEKGHLVMYCWDEQKLDGFNLPDWFSQLCSFERERLYSNPYDTAKVFRKNRKFVGVDVASFAASHTTEENVDADTVRGILDRHVTSLSEISAVQIDTEGFDYNVVTQLPFEDPSFRPCVVAWEDVLLTREQNIMLTELLHGYGYGLDFEFQNRVMYRWR